MQIDVTQAGLDVEVTGLDPAGTRISHADSPIANLGIEPLSFCTTSTGSHRIELRSTEARVRGAFDVSVIALRPLTQKDRRHCIAVQKIMQADALRRSVSAPSGVRAENLYRQAAHELASNSAGLRERVIAMRRLAQLEAGRGDFRSARLTLLQALAPAGRLGDAQLKAGIWNALSTIAYSLDDGAETRRCSLEALSIAVRGGAALEEASARNDLANLDNQQGETARALVGYYRTLLSYRLYQRHSSEATLLTNLGDLLLSLGRFQEARDVLEKSIRLNLSLPSEHTDFLRTLTFLGEVHLEAGNIDLAQRFLRMALFRAQRSGSQLYLARISQELANVHQAMGHSSLALARIRRSVSMFRQIGAVRPLAWALANSAWILEQQSRPDVALLVYKEALKSFRLMGDKRGEAFCLFGQAQWARRRQDLGEARELLEVAVERVEQLYLEAPQQLTGSRFFAMRQPYLETYIDVLMSLDERQPTRAWSERAFEVNEIRRAHSFFAAIGEARVALARQEGEEIQKESAAKLSQLERERLNGSTRPELQADQRTALLDLVALRASNLSANNLHASGIPHPLGLRDIQRRLLKDGSLLLVYELSEPTSILWVVDKNRISTIRIAGRSILEPLSNQVHELMRNGEGGSDQARLVMRRLSDEILRPAASRLGTRRLILVLDGALHSVPFAALPDPASLVVEGRKEPLVRRHELVSLDSPSVLNHMRRGPRALPEGALAVIADPVFAADDPRLLGAGAIAGKESLGAKENDDGVDSLEFPRLLASGDEAKSLVNLAAPGKTLSLVDFAANRQEVVRGVLRGFRIVHFATHGIVNPDNPELSGLVLSLVDEDGKPRNGFLHGFEIGRLGLNADLVVLSSCRSADGLQAPGEGILGLTRSFMESGTPRLVVSLWEVEDRSTSEFMPRFYRFLLKDRMSPSAALRAAQLSMIDDAHGYDPSSWAAFRFIGDWQ